MKQKPKYEDMPDPHQEVCLLMQGQLEAHMAEFNPVQLKDLEESGQLRQYLEERSSQARLVYLDARRAGWSRLQAGELADKELYPPPEASEDEAEDQELC